ncbi:MAG TPA: GTP cyclohydrolase I [Kofleriaceae bacterium]|nr:GTP cyclohydrolase I [Kofleriaceae bacterium]
MDRQTTALQKFEEGYEKILEGMRELGYRVEEDANLDGTPARAARGLAELLLDQEDVKEQVAAMLTKTFPASYKEMVISKHNVAFGCCPHHLLPVIYRVSVAYIARSKVLGISKLSRIVKLLARAPLLQEDLTHNLARLLHEEIESDGSAVYIEGLHLCMAARGSGTHEARVVTSAVRGVFLDQLATREEFIKLVTASPPNLV